MGNTGFTDAVTMASATAQQLPSWETQAALGTAHLASAVSDQVLGGRWAAKRKEASYGADEEQPDSKTNRGDADNDDADRDDADNDDADRDDDNDDGLPTVLRTPEAGHDMILDRILALKLDDKPSAELFTPEEK